LFENYESTRLPSNLRPHTTREWAHLVTHGHFWSLDKDGGHAIRSAESKNPVFHAARKFDGFVF